MKSLFLFCLTISISPLIMAQKPIATKIPKELIAQKHERIDNYYWMNQRDSADVLEYINQENEYCEKYFKPLSPLVDELMEEFDQRIDPNEQGAPFYFNTKLFQVKSEKGLEYQKIFLKEGEKEILFFDQNERAEGNEYYDLADWEPSPDNKLLAV
ncbi:hypothetical protein OAK92_02825, partial [Crocinitomicaceae bacterium]|nr:hypothetical protein [Crocinitomicaceae bacterium]